MAPPEKHMKDTGASFYLADNLGIGTVDDFQHFGFRQAMEANPGKLVSSHGPLEASIDGGMSDCY
jgi:hypothetical protein